MATPHIANQFTGLPVSDLIGGPLQAACQAQTSLAQSTADFIKQVGIDEKTSEVKMVDFKFTRPIADVNTDNNGTAYGEEQVQLKVPFLSIINTPSLKIKDVKITFDMEVKETTSEKSSLDTSASMEGNMGWGIGVFSANVGIKGSVSTHKENTRTTDNSAKYHFEVIAQDTGMTEGLSRVYDILQSAIAPRKIENKAQPAQIESSSTPKEEVVETEV